ncbi:MAG: helix-turn-helix domain-containing protein [Candidatus Aenigmatarchaeota archaeon]
MSKEILEELKKLNKKLDVILVVQLAAIGLKLKEISKVIGVSERTIQRWVPFKKLSKGDKK